MVRKGKILVVDDEEIVLKSCQRTLEKAGYEVGTALNGFKALQMINEDKFDLVLTDMIMPELDGMGLLREIKSLYPDLPVVMFTGFSTVKSAVEAMKMGAVDYIPKPFSYDELLLVVDRIMGAKAIKGRADSAETIEEKALQDIVWKSPAMNEVILLIKKAAATNCTVIIMGESGTGKELVAHAIHKLSKRRNEPFVAIDCSVLPRDLLENELFGHVKGAFTGALNYKKGLFELADKGTLFLDEIGDISVEFQGKLLRVLQERVFRQVGGTEDKKVNVRFIFATNKDLKTLVKNKQFREDLFYRIYVFPIVIPPLRERVEDIPLLVEHFLKKFAPQSPLKNLKISDEAMQQLMSYDWPGNVRQLENTIERMVVLADTEILTAEHLPPEIKIRSAKPGLIIPRTNTELKKLKKKIKKEAVMDIERLFVLNALERNRWNITNAARDVNMQRPNFHALMRKLKIYSK